MSRLCTGFDIGISDSPIRASILRPCFNRAECLVRVETSIGPRIVPRCTRHADPRTSTDYDESVLEVQDVMSW